MNVNEQSLVGYISGIRRQVLDFQERTKQLADVALRNGLEAVQSIEDMANTFFDFKAEQRLLLEKLSAMEEVFDDSHNIIIDDTLKAFIIDFADSLNTANIDITLSNTGLYQENSFKQRFLKIFETQKITSFDKLFNIPWGSLKEFIQINPKEQELFLKVLFGKIGDISLNENDDLLETKLIQSLKIFKDTDSQQGTGLKVIMSKILAELQYMKPSYQTGVK